jgi:2-phosphosulfolactate phosphatase
MTKEARTLEVLFTPAEFAALHERNLSNTVCVVFDVLRATSSMVVALANGAEAIVPVSEISEAVALRGRDPRVVLAGERDGVRIHGGLAGGTEFDLGNSPREFTREQVGGKTIVTTTTNGTRALRACAGAKRAFAASFLNLRVTADKVAAAENVILVCSGTFEEAAYEDVLAAGAMCDLLWPTHGAGTVSDSARMARRFYRLEKDELLEAISSSRNGRRLLSIPELREDVAFCVQRDIFALVAELGKDGSIKAIV